MVSLFYLNISNISEDISLLNFVYGEKYIFKMTVKFLTWHWQTYQTFRLYKWTFAHTSAQSLIVQLVTRHLKHYGGKTKAYSSSARPFGL